MQPFFGVFAMQTGLALALVKLLPVLPFAPHPCLVAVVALVVIVHALDTLAAGIANRRAVWAKRLVLGVAVRAARTMRLPGS